MVVIDNLNTRAVVSICAAFEPDKTKRLFNRLEFRSALKYGGWPNMVEIGLSALARQCLDRRMAGQGPQPLPKTGENCIM
jgi:hypothetical protein